MNLKKLNILLADDDADDCIFFKEALEGLPLSTHFTAVTDGEQLMQFLTNETTKLPDVLFLDINMPRKSGLECLSEIKQNKKLKDLPVVMFSTSNSWDTINMLFKSGANVYIHKPSDFSQLKQVIHHALPIAAENTFSTSQLKYVLNS
jgi:CheY-like chemotaxis protein